MSSVIPLIINEMILGKRDAEFADNDTYITYEFHRPNGVVSGSQKFEGFPIEINLPDYFIRIRHVKRNRI